MREPTPQEVEAWEDLQVDIAEGKHYTHHCCPETCGGTSYDPCQDAKEKYVD